jgi:hypothetical protein
MTTSIVDPSFRDGPQGQTRNLFDPLRNRHQLSDPPRNSDRVMDLRRDVAAFTRRGGP